MRIGVPRERGPRERRVAAVPDGVRGYTGNGWHVVVETGAGLHAGHTDDDYATAGAVVVADPAVAHDADLVLRVGPPRLEEIALLREGAAVAGFLEPFLDAALLEALAERGVTGLAVEAVPRTTLAQTMDALSSQATAAGYAAALLAATSTPRFLPMLVTAAGTIPPARALVLGVGVAGLQAIATLKRLGAVVHAYDVRPETREQVESLGARFVEAPTVEADEQGYAREVDEDVQRRQWETLAPYVAEADVIVATAQIPGRPAPRLVTADMLASMRQGAVVVDLAAATGGNAEGSRPDEEVVVGGVRLLGPTDLPSRVAADASRMYARNLQALVERMTTDDGFVVDLDDEIVGEVAVVHAGEVRHPKSRALLGLPEVPT